MLKKNYLRAPIIGPHEIAFFPLQYTLLLKQFHVIHLWERDYLQKKLT